MKIYKFGGASIATAQKIAALLPIIQPVQNEPLCLVISAMGQTTNELETVVQAYYQKDFQTAKNIFARIREQHTQIAQQLLQEKTNAVELHLTQLYTEVEWILNAPPTKTYAYYYDQIVCIGELLSTCIISQFLQAQNIPNTWVDSREIIRTNSQFRDAVVNWPLSKQQIEKNKTLFKNLSVVQGFIGSTSENESTTLGREGSDYTAALFANLLDAHSVTIWKDVEGLMTADPKVFKNYATLIPHISYREVIEIAYYGAKVIHPKTIQPLQQKNIPLHVRCFAQPKLASTTIHDTAAHALPPILVATPNQVLIQFGTLDFSFIQAHLLTQLYASIEKIALPIKLLQLGPLQIQLCTDYDADKLILLEKDMRTHFHITSIHPLNLLTIRGYNAATIADLLSDKTIVLQQQTPTIFQALYHHSPSL